MPALINSDVALAYLAAVSSALLAVSVLVQRRRSFASWCFLAGMLIFSAEALLTARSFRASSSAELARCQQLALLARSFGPVVWIAFSLSYSRGNYVEFLRRWRLALVFAAVVPPAITLLNWGALFVIASSSGVTRQHALFLLLPAKLLNVLLLGGILLVLVNFERTFHAAVGTMRWRMKFLLLGLALVFGARLYTRTQTLLFSTQNLELVHFETGSLFIGCLLIAVAHLRRGFSEVDVYPSHAVLKNSITFLLAGCYLFLVGMLAQVAKWKGGSSAFQLQALILLAGVAGLGLLLVSERLRQRIKYFVSRHLRRPHHDFRQLWPKYTERLIASNNEVDACSTAAKTISETFDALSVTIWLLDDERRWVFGASTSESAAGANRLPLGELHASEEARLALRAEPFNLENIEADWGSALREASNQQFTGRSRQAAALIARGRVLGVAVLGDRVYKLPYSVEDLELLRCLADQLAATLLNFRLSQGLAKAQELETFQTMSAFFVHDLKNSAASLNLMLQNLPQHFDNPEFRADALRGLGKAAGRINELIARLSSFRGELQLDLRNADLNELVAEVVQYTGSRSASVRERLDSGVQVRVDREQIRSVITNLIVNAIEASPADGIITVSTERFDTQALLTVSDSGCGMSSEFICRLLFRPFHTTKKKGIGIGMFQSRMIVEAHRGRIQVHSEEGKGTTFRVSLLLAGI